jgi:hypothetical protein
LYENVEFGTKERPPQVQSMLPQLCTNVGFGLPPFVQSPTTLGVSAGVKITYDEFETYVRCPRQYFFRYKLKLSSEVELDPSYRARRAIHDALLSAAKGSPAQASFDIAWAAHRLPSYAEDPGLYSDAVSVCTAGLELIASLNGRIIEGVEARLAEVTVALPWVLHSAKTGNTLIRISLAGAKKSVALLRPLLLDAPKLPSTVFNLRTLLAPKTLEVPISKAPEKTDAYKSAIGLLRGDFSPVRGPACGRCSYSTICPGIHEVSGSQSGRAVV